MDKKKYFIITIDTEGDNLWSYNFDKPIKTTNAQYLPRFQELCEEFNFKPVYLVNYEMAQDDFFHDFAKNTLARNMCEIGIHIHAWNNPPHYELMKDNKTGGLPYLIEYPRHVMFEKFSVLYQTLSEKFGAEIVSHRSGRWAMNQDYFDILIEHNIKTDCSVTPHVSWRSAMGYTQNSFGSNYLSYTENPYMVKHTFTAGTILEVPVTIRKLRDFSFSPIGCMRTLLKNIKFTLTGKPIWLRPNGKNLQDMLTLTEHIKKTDSDYLMFMLHSSELMPSGNPTFKTKESIEQLYTDLRILFENIAKTFTGITLKDYTLLWRDQ